MFGLNDHEKIQYMSTYLTRYSGGCPIPSDATTDVLNSLGATVDFIYFWLKVLVCNYAWRCRAYQDKMKELFAEIPKYNPVTTSEYYDKTHQLLLTDFGEG